MSTIKIGALVLAGGKGTRMHSNLPKVLQPILNEPILSYVYKALYPVFDRTIWTIVGHGADSVREAFPKEKDKFIFQEKQLGTGHALKTAWQALVDAQLDYVLVVNGDTPQLEESTLRTFLAKATDQNNVSPPALSFASLLLDNPSSFGRVIRKSGTVHAIIEAKDDTCTTSRKEYEVNAGMYCLHIKSIGTLIDLLSDNNKSNEFYITDLIGLAVEHNLSVEAFPLESEVGIMGVNTPRELVTSEESIREKIVNWHLDNGVTIHNPNAVRISPHATVGKGTHITGPCEIYGNSSIGEACTIESYCKFVNSHIASNVTVKSYSFFEDAIVQKDCNIGPFARLRPGAEIKEHAHIGNFVEIKKSVIETGAKVNHLSYIGDAVVGEKTNIGAGTITCNYDGINKSTTRIGKNAFIGSNTALVAPVSVGNNSLIAAGSVITANVPDGEMGIARERQVNILRKSAKE